jgi:hypothetical protein
MRGEEDIASNQSDCDIGKGISRVMDGHEEDEVHTSYNQFSLKKKNHSTFVHRSIPTPRSNVSEESGELYTNVFRETRPTTTPHHSHKAFGLKKKYHQTSLHCSSDSRLHPNSVREKQLQRHPSVLVSQQDVETLKKVHGLTYDPEKRRKPDPRPSPVAPVPRNGQWTPQHVLD